MCLELFKALQIICVRKKTHPKFFSPRSLHLVDCFIYDYVAFNSKGYFSVNCQEMHVIKERERQDKISICSFELIAFQ